MSRSLLENFVSASDTLLRIFVVLAAVSAIVYFFSTRQLARTHKRPGNAAAVDVEQRSGEQAQLSAAQKRIAELQRENARLGGEVEAEKQARLDVQRRFGPRGVLPASASAMIEGLAPFVGQRVNFAYFTELETAHFAERVLDVLRRAGWKPQVFKVKTMAPLYGVHCGGPNADDTALKALSEALALVDKHLTTQDADAAAALRSVQPQMADQLWVLVALKRPPLRIKQQANGDNEEHGAVDRD